MTTKHALASFLFLIVSFGAAHAAAPLTIPTTVAPYKEWRLYRPFTVQGAPQVAQKLNELVLQYPAVEIEKAYSEKHDAGTGDWDLSALWQLRTPEPHEKLQQVLEAYQSFEKTLSGGELEFVRSLADLQINRSPQNGDTWLLARLPVARGSDLSLSPISVKRYVFAEARISARLPYRLESDGLLLPSLKEDSADKKRILAQLTATVQSEIVFTYRDEELQRGEREVNVPLESRANNYEVAYLTFHPGGVKVSIGINYYGMPSVSDVYKKEAPFVGFSESGDALYETGEYKNEYGYWIKGSVAVSPTGNVRVHTYIWSRHGFLTSLHLRHGDYDERYAFAGQAEGVSIAH